MSNTNQMFEVMVNTGLLFHVEVDDAHRFTKNKIVISTNGVHIFTKHIVSFRRIAKNTSNPRVTTWDFGEWEDINT